MSRKHEYDGNAWRSRPGDLVAFDGFGGQRQLAIVVAVGVTAVTLLTAPDTQVRQLAMDILDARRVRFYQRGK